MAWPTARLSQDAFPSSTPRNSGCANDHPNAMTSNRPTGSPQHIVAADWLMAARLSI